MNQDVPIEVHRLKARLVFIDGNVKLVQGVREVFEIFDGEKSATISAQPGKIVLIGRGLKEVDFEVSFLEFIQNC